MLRPEFPCATASRPTRTIGSVRVYSRDEIERVRIIKHLVDEAGVNLAGVQRLLSIAEWLAPGAI